MGDDVQVPQRVGRGTELSLARSRLRGGFNDLHQGRTGNGATACRRPHQVAMELARASGQHAGRPGTYPGVGQAVRRTGSLADPGTGQRLVEHQAEVGAHAHQAARQGQGIGTELLQRIGAHPQAANVQVTALVHPRLGGALGDDQCHVAGAAHDGARRAGQDGAGELGGAGTHLGRSTTRYPRAADDGLGLALDDGAVQRTGHRRNPEA